MPVGSKLGPYEILSPLGAGGMGEVWRARDTRLNREVAIKVLPAELASDRDRLARFEQEARSASALNHPGIVTIYEVGKSDAVSYIAMELVQGSTLRELIAAGPIAPKRLMGIALIAAEESEVTQVETVGQPTRPGVVLGTVGYMSPEQASGRPVDFRSDQFSFGSVLYEMATGKRAFSRGTTVETLTAIIRDEPEPFGSLSPQAPAALRRVVERCLEKDPEERYLSTKDLALDLAHLRDHASEISGERSAATAAARPRRRLLALLFLPGLFLAAAAGIFAGRRMRRDPAAPAVKFAMPIPPGKTYAPSEVSRGMSISPDGTRLVIEAFSNGRRRLFSRTLDNEDFSELDGSIDATSHFWSPDSRFIAFYAEGKLKKIPATGGPPVTLCDAPFAVVGTWNREGTILFSNFNPPGIYRVADTGGEAVRVVAPDASRHQLNPIWPHFLPDGRRFLYVAGVVDVGEHELRVASLDTKETRDVARINSRVEYVAPGYLIYVRESTLFAQPFDERKAELQDEPRLLASNVHYFYGPSHAAFSVSQTGVLVYQTASRPSRLVWLDRRGKELGQLGEPAVVKGLRISPDGARAAADIEDRRTGTSDLWVFDLARSVSTRLHSDPVDEIMPVWSPDGSKVVYRSDRGGPPDIYEIAPGVPGSDRPLLEQPGVQQPEDFSRDGR
ncbi:MAG: protein kinase, partial [Acidobacteria bacterium]|nr:protein kinase [Acidobacteriota bacterium]